MHARRSTDDHSADRRAATGAFRGGREAERTAYAPLRGTECAHVVAPARAQAQAETTRVPEGLDQAASSSNRRLGSLRGSIRPGGPKSARPESGTNSMLGPSSPPGTKSRQPPDDDHQQIDHRFESHASDGSCCLIHRWSKKRCLLFVGFGRPFGPTEDTLLSLTAILPELRETATQNYASPKR